MGQKTCCSANRSTTWETSSQVLLVRCRNSVSCGGFLAFRFGFPTDAETRRSHGSLRSTFSGHSHMGN
jgi:hypothetical protein